MESVWRQLDIFLTTLYDEDMKFAFATFQGGPLKFIAFEKSKKKNVNLLFGEVFVEVAVVVAEVSYYFQPGASVSTQMTSPSEASLEL